MAARLTLESVLLDIIRESEAIDNETTTDRFKSRDFVWKRARWLFENAIDVRVERANNEQKGYEESDIGFPTIPMRTKAETGERQTADYVLFWKFKFEEEIEGKESPYRKMGICFERKAVEDFHGTIISNYERFDRELDRFLCDPKTLMMIVLVEGSLAEALTYYPPVKRYSGDLVKNMIAIKLGAISSIEVRGVHISFRGSRKASVNSIKSYVTHFFEKHITFILRDVIKEIKENGTANYQKPIVRTPKPDNECGDVETKPTKKLSGVQPRRTYRKRSNGTKKKTKN